MKRSTHMSAQSRARRFVREIRRSTGVSANFLEAATPAVVSAFTDIDGAPRVQLLELIVEVARYQASSEAALARAVEVSLELGRVSAGLQAELLELQKSAAKAFKDIAMASSFDDFPGAGEATRRWLN